MNLMMWIARSAGLVCVRFTALCQRTLRVLGSILPTSNLRHAALTSIYVNVIDSHGTLTARAFKGSERAATRIARSVAIVIGIALSMQSTAVGQGSIDRYYDLHSLADYQLTDRQLDCHNEITFRESSNRIDARNGSHYGYYQIRNTKLIDAPYDYQFYFYWKYVQHRYGYTEYDEPDYCKALHHLKTKGWQ
jgi:hypothetical protein